VSALAGRVAEELAAVADPARAPRMQAYMKSTMPYLGVSAVPLRQACKRAFAGLSYASSGDWQADVLAVWRSARYREQWCAAIELTGIRAARPFQHVDALPMYREMIAAGAWWDVIDSIAPRLGMILANDRTEMSGLLRRWARDDDMWIRRSAIISQLSARQATDLALLYDCIEPSLDSNAFFLRKAIGWALRQYARTDPQEVSRYVKANERRLSGLSRREALKHIGRTLP
jgi:3-methyladenine DNA glycosylase AlkD